MSKSQTPGTGGLAPLLPGSLREERLRVGVSIQELSFRSGVSHARLSMIERGISVPRPGEEEILRSLLQKFRGAR